MCAAKKQSKKREEFRDAEWPAGLFRRPTGMYHWRRSVDGDRRSKSLKTKRMDFAIAKAVELNAEIEKGARKRDLISNSSMSFEEAAEHYIKHRQLTESTAKRYRAQVENFTTVCAKLIGRTTVNLDDIDNNLMTEYMALRAIDPKPQSGHKNTPKSRKASPKTIDNEITFVKSVLTHSVANNFISNLPMITVQVKHLPKRGQASAIARPLEEGEIPQLLQAAKDYDRKHQGVNPYDTYFHDIICTFIYSGMRHGELQYLEWSDVDFGSDLIGIRSKSIQSTRRLVYSEDAARFFGQIVTGRRNDDLVFTDESDITRAGDYLKFKKREVLAELVVGDFDLARRELKFTENLDWRPKATESEVVLHPKLKAILKRLKVEADSNFVFPAPDGGYWRMRFERKLKKIADMAGLDGSLRVHDLRHTTGAMLRRKGVALETIKEILRHKNLEDTLIYAKYEHAEGRTAIVKISW